MGTVYRPIQPALPSDHGDGGQGFGQPVSTQGKRAQVTRAACTACRKRKTKCDGGRPTCSKCAKYDFECVYEVNAGESRAQGIRRVNKQLQGELDATKQVLGQLGSGSEAEKARILARLAGGEQAEDIAQLANSDEQLALPSSSKIGDGSQVVEQLSTISATQHDPLQDSASAWQGEQGPSLSPLHSPTSQASELDLLDSDWPMIDDDLTTAVEGIGDSFLQPDETSLFLTPTSIQDTTTEGLLSYSPELPVGSPEASTAGAGKSKFLPPLFKREEYLLGMVGSRRDMSVGSETVDPKVLQHTTDEEFEEIEEASTALTEIHKLDLSSTPLNSRQAMDTKIRVHPNLQKLLGSLPFYRNVPSNTFSSVRPDSPARNDSVPTWAVMTTNTKPGFGRMREAFTDIYNEATALLRDGTSLDDVTGAHPNIAALYDIEEYERSSLLSRWAARMVYSIKLKGYGFTCFASMYTFWYIMRWMISPSPETYEVIPEWLRPTPNQLVMPHINFIDFLIWPAFRELAVQIPAMQEHMGWLMDMSIYMQCRWAYRTEEALYLNPLTGFTDLTDAAKECMRTLQNWSVGPTFRTYVPNADAYVNIRI
ncbi:hypothetical protein F5B20DRAFT_546857 [Whalleya microplaca]|nr:hypothetical protein F5B20DRAFT_546857 [Whalleya microplaca]